MQNEYWINELEDIYSFNNFLKDIDSSKIFDRIKYDFSNYADDLVKFLDENDFSFFEFYTGIISLYLSRTGKSEGVIFSYSNSNPEDTLFKIKYDGESSVFDFMVRVKNIISNALDNSMENLKEYVNELYPDYCDHIFNYSVIDQTKDLILKPAQI